MKSATRDLEDRYARALQDYLQGTGEPALREAYEIGRRSIESAVGLLDLAAIHCRVLATLLGSCRTPEECARIAGAAVDLFAECISPYEMALRGFRESSKKLLFVNEALERRGSELTAANETLANEIAERKHAEEQLRLLNQNLQKQTAELQAVNRELEAFTYSVSHDLRAPLRHMDGFSKILLEEYGSKLEPQAQHYLKRVRESAQHMGKLVDDLLNLSRVGRRELKVELAGLDSLVQEVLLQLNSETKGREIEWQVGSLPFVECDAALMKQVFANLLSNAVKFTRPRKHALIQVDQATVNGQAAIFVRDNGVGFSMKHADKLFGIFQRLHRQEDFEGTGVGLATVQRIIHRHGGRVWAEGGINRGATFYFTLAEPEISPAEDTATHPVRR
jgi:signal transduction histidine kinase